MSGFVDVNLLEAPPSIVDKFSFGHLARAALSLLIALMSLTYEGLL